MNLIHLYSFLGGFAVAYGVRNLIAGTVDLGVLQVLTGFALWFSALCRHMGKK
jgi:hypothetical protein